MAKCVDEVEENTHFDDDILLQASLQFEPVTCHEVANYDEAASLDSNKDNLFLLNMKVTIHRTSPRSV